MIYQTYRLENIFKFENNAFINLKELNLKGVLGCTNDFSLNKNMGLEKLSLGLQLHNKEACINLFKSIANFEKLIYLKLFLSFTYDSQDIGCELLCSVITKTLEKLRSLETLKFEFITYDDSKSIIVGDFTKLENLKKLKIKFHSFVIEDFLMNEPKNLKSLDMNFVYCKNSIETKKIEKFNKFLESCQKLEKLSLNVKSAFIFSHIKYLEKLDSLKSLNLRIFDSDIKEKIEGTFPKNLNELELNLTRDLKTNEPVEQKDIKFFIIKNCHSIFRIANMRKIALNLDNFIIDFALFKWILKEMLKEGKTKDLDILDLKVRVDFAKDIKSIESYFKGLQKLTLQISYSLNFQYIGSIMNQMENIMNQMGFNNTINPSDDGNESKYSYKITNELILIEKN